MFTYSKFLCMTTLLVLSAQASDKEDGILCKSVEKEGEIETPGFPRSNPYAPFKVKKGDTFVVKIIQSPEVVEMTKEKAEDLCKKFKGTSEFIKYAFSDDKKHVSSKIQDRYPGKEIHICDWAATFTINE